MTIGEKITKLRKSKGFSQIELAEQIGTSRQSVSKWELSETIPDAENIIKISKLFEVSTDFLLKDVITENTEKSEIKKKYNTVPATILTLFGILTMGIINTLAHIQYTKNGAITYGKDLIVFINNFGLNWLAYLAFFAIGTGALLFIFDIYIHKSNKYKNLEKKPLKLFIALTVITNLIIFIIVFQIIEC